MTTTQKIGFIGLGIMGAPMAGHLLAAGHQLFVHTRSQVPADLTAKGAVACPDAASVARAVEGADAVINLVGLLYESGRQTFQAVHVDAARTIAQAAAAAGARLVQMSALGADPASAARYARTKAAGE